MTSKLQSTGQPIWIVVVVATTMLINLTGHAQDGSSYINTRLDDLPSSLIRPGHTVDDHIRDFGNASTDYKKQVQLFIKARDDERWANNGFGPRDGAFAASAEELQKADPEALAEELERLATELAASKNEHDIDGIRNRFRKTQGDLVGAALNVHRAARTIQERRYSDAKGALAAINASVDYSQAAQVTKQSSIFDLYIALGLWRAEADTLETALSHLLLPPGGEQEKDERLKKRSFWLGAGLNAGQVLVAGGSEAVLRKYAKLLARERAARKGGQTGRTVAEVAENADEALDAARTADRAEDVLDVADELTDAAKKPAVRRFVAALVGARRLTGRLASGGFNLLRRSGHWLMGTWLGRAARGTAEIALIALVLDGVVTAANSDIPIALHELGINVGHIDDMAPIMAELKSLNDEFEVAGIDLNQPLELFEAQALSEGIALAVVAHDIERNIRRIEDEIRTRLQDSALTSEVWQEKFGNLDSYYLEKVAQPLPVFIPRNALPNDTDDFSWVENLTDYLGL